MASGKKAPQPRKPNEWWQLALQSGALVVLFSAFIYFLGYSFESGFLEFFHIRSAHVQVSGASYIEMLTSLSAFWVAAFWAVSYKDDHIFFKNKSKSTEPNGKYTLVQKLLVTQVIPLAVFAIVWFLMDMWFISHNGWKHAVFSVWNGFFLYYVLIVILIISVAATVKYIKDFLAKDNGGRAMTHYITEGILIIVIIAGSLAAFSSIANQLGRRAAKTQGHWPSTVVDKDTFIIVRQYGNEMIAVRVCENDKNKIVDNEYRVIQRNKDISIKSVKLELENNIFCN